MFEMDKFDPKALEGDITKLIEAQIGASVKVTLSKFERTNPGYTNDRAFITFVVNEDWSGALASFRSSGKSGVPDAGQGGEQTEAERG